MTATVPVPDSTTLRFELRPRPPFRLDLTVWAHPTAAPPTRRGRRRAAAPAGSSGHPTCRSCSARAGAAPGIARRSRRGPGRCGCGRRSLRGRCRRPSSRAGTERARASFAAVCRAPLNATSSRGAFIPRQAAALPDAARVRAQRCRLPATLTRRRPDSAEPACRRRRRRTRGWQPAHLPGAEDILRLPPARLRTLGFSERKAETIRELATATTAGQLDLAALDQLDDVAASTRSPSNAGWSLERRLRPPGWDGATARLPP